MPQFELDRVGPDAVTGLHRGRDASDAVRRAARADAEVSDDADDAGWRGVTVGGAPSGRVRDHAARMRFRRD